MPQRVVREGDKAQEVPNLIEDERRASHRGSVSGGRASALAYQRESISGLAGRRSRIRKLNESGRPWRAE